MRSLSELRRDLNDCDRRREIWRRQVLSEQDRIELAASEERIEALWEDIRCMRAGGSQVLGADALPKAKRMVRQVSATLKRTTFAGLESYR